MTTSNVVHTIDKRIVDSYFVQNRASKPLRVCCYGSSSSKTPEPYMNAARALGYILAKRGHTCVNGAGSFGCMAAMNDGAAAGNGHIVGVIHEMWLVDHADWATLNLRDGGAHPVFSSENGKGSNNNDGPTREMLVASGNDLQERKRLLVENADALVVLPGGPGTWDELWEMACARNIGLTKLPIVCVNIDGYYDSFRQMLDRAWRDELTKNPPDDIVHFEDTAEGAVRWIESYNVADGPEVTLKKRSTALRHASIMSDPITARGPHRLVRSLSRSLSKLSNWATSSLVGSHEEGGARRAIRSGALFTIGVATGLALAKSSWLGKRTGSYVS